MYEQCTCTMFIPAPHRTNLGLQLKGTTGTFQRFFIPELFYSLSCSRGMKANREKTQRVGPTCGEVDVCKQDDVCGDERDEFSNANLLLEVDMNHVVVSQCAVGCRMELLQTCSQAAQEAEYTRYKKLYG